MFRNMAAIVAFDDSDDVVEDGVDGPNERKQKTRMEVSTTSCEKFVRTGNKSPARAGWFGGGHPIACEQFLELAARVHPCPRRVTMRSRGRFADLRNII
jgi:hypothetical protein